MTLPICFARWWLFYSNMDHMSLRLHLFQLKLERINESPGLSSCYHDTRDKHGNQLWLKEIACRVFPSWLAHTHTREREIIEWQQKIYKNIQTKQKTRKRCKFIHFVHQRSVGETFYHSMMSILLYFKPAENEALSGEALQTSTGEVSSTQNLCRERTKRIDAAKREKEKEASFSWGYETRGWVLCQQT